MSRLTRRDMKRDEVQEGMFTAVDWLAEHARTILIAAGALLGVGVLVVLALRILDGREERAQAKLANALQIYAAPINETAADPDHPRSPSFPSEEARRARALETFAAIHERYGSTAAGRVAGIYVAELAAHEGDYERARELWEQFLRRESDHALGASVRLNLIALERLQGDGEQLVERLREQIDGSSEVPADLLLWELGVTLEEQGRLEEAEEAFQRLVDEYPASAYAGDAQARLASAA